MALTVTIAGMDRTAWVEPGIRRSMTIAGGSKATLTFRMNNAKGRSIERPPMGAEIVVTRGSETFFAGVVDNIDEIDYTGSAALDVITVYCVDYGALCDRRVVGRVIAASEASTVNDVMAMLTALHADLGLTFVPGADPGVTLGDTVFNWCTLSEAYTQVAQAANCGWRVDFDKNVYLCDRNTGYATAPWIIDQDNGLFADPHLIVDMSRYRNRVGVRNSASIQGLQSRTFTGDGSGTDLQLYGQASGGTWLVNGVEVPGTLIDGISSPSYIPPAGGGPATPGWTPVSAVRLASPPANGDTVQANYISPLSLIAWAEDASEIATYGLFECVEEARDINDLTTLQAIADELLVRRKRKPTTFTFRTDEDGLEPGMVLPIDLTRPLVSDTLLITSVSSEEIGKDRFFRHQITATNQPQDISAEVNGIASDLAYLGRISKMRQQPVDRVIDRIGFNIAETVEGLTNPGLTAGTKLCVNQAQKTGVVREFSLVFNSVLDNPATMTILQNGTAVGSITASAGSTVARVYPWSSGPLPVTRGDIFTLESETTEPSAKDGHLEIVVVGG